MEIKIELKSESCSLYLNFQMNDLEFFFEIYLFH